MKQTTRVLVAGIVTALNLVVGAPTSRTFTVVEAQNLPGPNVHIRAGLNGIALPDRRTQPADRPQ